jgi:glyoxylase-like metal-dependent hydrolase (beta-lactamase superfamily II)
MDQLKAGGRAPRAVFLTHHHGDHVGAALWLKERLGLPIWAHARTADRLLPGAVDRLLVDGEVISLAGDPVMTLRVLHTPGHARGHLCLVDERSRAAIVGDMVAGLGTILIDPPEGDMRDYLAQLERLRDLPVSTLYPAHGPAIPDGPAKLDEYLLHRRVRERKVVDALAVGDGATTLQEIVATAYSDTAAALHPVAERSALAILLKLIEEKRVTCANDRYALSTPGDDT